jgi:hypothetical protein
MLFSTSGPQPLRRAHERADIFGFDATLLFNRRNVLSMSPLYTTNSWIPQWYDFQEQKLANQLRLSYRAGLRGTVTIASAKAYFAITRA